MATIYGSCSGRLPHHYSLWAEVSEHQVHVKPNTSYVTVNVYVQSDMSNSAYNKNATNPVYLQVDGSVKVNTKISIDTRNKARVLLATWTGTVSHNSNGAKWLPIYFSFSMDLSGNPTLSGGSINSGVSLTTIDRAAPSCNLSIGSVTSSSIAISVSSDSTCNQWWYSTNSGNSWSRFSTSSTTSVSTTITGLSPNVTYGIRACCRRAYNDVDGYSTTKSTTTLGGSILNSVSNVTIDTSPSVTINGTLYSTSFYHRLTVTYGSTTLATINLGTGTKGSNSRTITFDASQKEAILKAMANTKSINATYSLRTYSSSSYSSQIGNTSSRTATISISSGSSPTIEPFTFSDINTKTTSVTGNNQVLIKKHSTLQLVVPQATPKNFATISNYLIQIGDDTKSSATAGTIVFGGVNTSGENTLTVTATDSRGYTCSTSQKVTIIDYSDITIDGFMVRRINEVDPQVQLTVEGTYSPIYVDAVKKNEFKSLQFRCKESTASAYGSWIDLTPVNTNDSSFNYATENLGGLSFDSDKAFNLQVKSTDKLSEDIVDMTVIKGTPLVSFRDKMVGVNNPDPKGALDVKGTIYGQNIRNLDKLPHVQENEDLNNYTKVGCYAITNNNTASTIQNIPIPHAGVLTIYSANGQHTQEDIDNKQGYIYLMQTFESMYGEKYQRGLQVNNNGTWQYEKWYCVNGKIVPIKFYKTASFNNSSINTWFHVPGMEIVIPPYSLYNFSLFSGWASGKPTQTAISKSKDKLTEAVLSVSVDNSYYSSINCTVSGYNNQSTPLTLYGWEKNGSTSGNAIQYVEGFFITLA